MQPLLLVVCLASALAVCGATVCPGGDVCPGDQTCCATASGEGCCPWANADCCSDMQHCCPAGYSCDLAAGKCSKGEGDSLETVDWMVKLGQTKRSKPIAQNLTVGSHMCPDQQQTCPDGYTCCALSDSGYGCCPFGNAVCCADKIHCCPEGQTCSLEEQRCTQKITVMSVPKKVEDNGICPDHSYCAGSSTCCPIGGGHYGCCPLVAATCCPDMQHCCPHGTYCTSSGFCVRQKGTQNDIPLIFKLR